MKWRSTAWVSLGLVSIFVARALAAEIPEARLKIERVALFKSGLGYFTGSAPIPEKAMAVAFGELPVASLGTFWASYPKTLEVRKLYAVLEDGREERPADDLTEVLAASVGRKVKIYMAADSVPAVEGTVVTVVRPGPTEPTNPYVMGPREAPRAGYPVGQVVLVKTDRGMTAVNAGSIARADIETDAIATKQSIPVKKPRIRMDLAKEARGEKVSLSFLARGITWSPSYLLDLSSPRTARVAAQAIVVNEVADLDEVKLELVTGFPHLQFSEIVSPISMSQSLADFLTALERGRSQREDRSAVMGQAVRLNRNVASFEASDAPLPGYGTPAEGAVAEDLFLYPVEGFSLRRGETAYVPLFTAEVPYEHVYTWEIPDFLDEGERYRRREEAQGQPKAEEVWHACRLTNTMKMPWTTAPAEFVKEGRITGQDTLYYTAAGSKTTVKINRAMNVLADQGEVEVERKRAAVSLYGYTYDRVKVRGELQLRSKLEEPAAVEVTKDLSGDVLEKTPEAKDTALAEGLKRANTHHRLVWVVKLAPGETQKVTYVYEVLVRE